MAEHVPVGLFSVIACCTQRPSSHSIRYSEVGSGVSANNDKMYQNSPTNGWKKMILKVKKKKKTHIKRTK